MTYNIHYGVGRDKRYSLDRIIEVIRSQDPDVVALQEVDNQMHRTNYDHQSRIIAGALDMYWDYCVVSFRGTAEFGIATLSKFPLGQSRHHDLSFNPRLKLRFRPRGILRTDVVLGPSVLHIFNLHLGLGIRERIHQSRKLLSGSILLDRTLNGPVVILGDFNDRPISVVHPRLKYYFNDTFKLSGGRDDATFYWGLLRLKLDHIYVCNRLYSVETHVVNTSLSRVASDHLPLLAKVDPKSLKRQPIGHVLSDL
ncbi:MAG TPA: endonuclease/exonuclease/phosphatase family protein [Thermodesulfobacteriota bacterium]|nr:endonuclease/exonuclease/phosphatase family protein [Thermodesulfobacteriota bacterium]